MRDLYQIIKENEERDLNRVIKENKERDLYQVIKEYKEREPCMLATALDGEHAGEKLLCCGGDVVWQSEGCGFLEANLKDIRESGVSGMVKIKETRVFTEYFGGKSRLVICGGGHVSVAIIGIGKTLGFDVTVLEDRPDFADRARMAGADLVICDSFEEGLKRIRGSLSTYFVIVTRGHRYDLLCLRRALGMEHAYAGMMGSRRRAAAAKRQLEEEGVDRALLDKVHMPIGLPIRAETPEEIAVSVMAEIIQCKNKERPTEGYRDEILDALGAPGSENGSPGQAVLAKIVWRRGSAPREIGAKLVVCQDGRVAGTIGGGCMEAEVVQAARLMLADGGAEHCLKLVELQAETAEEEGMVCGGTQLVYLEKRRCI